MEKKKEETTEPVRDIQAPVTENELSNQEMGELIKEIPEKERKELEALYQRAVEIFKQHPIGCIFHYVSAEYEKGVSGNSCILGSTMMVRQMFAGLASRNPFVLIAMMEATIYCLRHNPFSKEDNIRLLLKMMSMGVEIPDLKHKDDKIPDQDHA